ncbi:hypothetical protein [uncultured Microbulbifer sp.]|uniref:hypothetical protein n=1 Tax=uncultured Microbulbifer sp. TaxID=348147 RepID=UPI0025D9E7F1|nr:hypothetical protein [uncultured Microbulbifer sp.]
MELLQRYVDNVKTYLPQSLREDVGNELYSGLQDEYDDLSETLGRAPGELEIAALLKRRGHPMQVAAAFRPRRTQVSEALFPLYLQVLKWVILLIAIVNGVALALPLLGAPQPDFFGAVWRWLFATANAALQAFAWITLGFYFTGESLSFSNAFGKWDPRSLPRVAGGGHNIGQFDSGIELVAILLCAGWLNNLFSLVQPSFAGIELILAEQLRGLLPWINIALGAGALMAAWKLLLPYWTRSKILLSATIHGYWLLLLVLLFGLQETFAIQWHAAGVDHWVLPQGIWQAGVLVALVLSARDLWHDMRRLLRARYGR